MNRHIFCPFLRQAVSKCCPILGEDIALSWMHLTDFGTDTLLHFEVKVA